MKAIGQGRGFSLQESSFPALSSSLGFSGSLYRAVVGPYAVAWGTRRIATVHDAEVDGDNLRIVTEVAPGIANVECLYGELSLMIGHVLVWDGEEFPHFEPNS